MGRLLLDLDPRYWLETNGPSIVGIQILLGRCELCALPSHHKIDDIYLKFANGHVIAIYFYIQHSLMTCIPYRSDQIDLCSCGDLIAGNHDV